MLLLALVLLAAPEDLASRLRHLESAGSAEAPASSPDGSRIAFVTTLFGTRQAASMASEGGYPNQLTDEPGGVIALRYAPNDPKVLIALAMRGARRRLLFIDEEGAPAGEVDPAPGDQVPGGFTRDGKRFCASCRSTRGRPPRSRPRLPRRARSRPRPNRSRWRRRWPASSRWALPLPTGARRWR